MSAVITEELKDRKQKLSSAQLALLQKRLRGEMEQVKPIEPDVENLFEPFPMTEMCEAQWMGRNEAYELGGVSAHAYAEMFDGPMDIEAFERAWNTLVDHYEMFRAIVGKDGQYRILPRDEVEPYKVEVVDLRQKSQEEKDAYLAEVRDEWRREIMPGDEWPLFKFRASIIEDDHIRLHASLDLLITDIGSLQRIGRQLTKLYEDPSYDLGEPTELSFRDYNMAVTAFRKHPLYEKSEQYWLSRLDTLPPAPDMPVARDPEKVEYPYFTHDRRIIPADIWQKFQERSRKFGLTPDVTMNAVYADIVATWAKRQTFTLNVLSFKRLPIHRDVNKLAGNFGSTILLEVSDWGGRPFVDRAKGLHSQLLKDLDHWFYSGVTMLRELNRHKGGARGASMPVVFASTLNYSVEGTLLDSENFWDKYMTQLYLQTPQVWLDHQIAEDDGELHLEWDRVEELFPEGMTADMLDAYENLVTYLAESDDPWVASSRRHVLPEAHRAAHSELNSTDGAVSDELLHTLFARQAEERPDQKAVVTDSRILSYAEVDEMSNQVAHWLVDQGVKPNRFVALAMKKGWEQVVAALAVHKAGAAYLPVDPDTPTERLAYLLENAGATLVLTQEDLASEITWPEGVEHLAMDGDLSSLSTDALDTVQGPDDIAYMIYTSGSTGRPKGVVIDHRGAVNTILDINERFGIGAEDAVLGISAMSFDLSVYDLFGTLAAGATLVLPKELKTPDPAYWAELVQRENVTVWNSVPALMELVTEYVESHSKAADTLGSLRLALLSGDWIPVSLPDRLRAVAENVKVVSLGGATEASIWSILHEVDAVDPEWSSIPYGRPMKNQRFYVLDDYLDPKPFWVPGDLYIGGIGVAREYWGDEEKTRASFIIHPESGDRLYKTGDLGFLHPDGYIVFLGREDLQVKVRGFRIELGEIEAQIASHPAVESAVVVAMGADSETRRLVAYVVAVEGESVDAETITAYAAERLPEYMLPANVQVIETLPLTPNGKVDRRFLADPQSLEQWQKSKVYVAPRTETETEVAAIWASMLDLERVGVEDNFFELGGTSLLVNQMAARIYDAFGIELSMGIVFESPTVTAMAEAIDAALENPDLQQADDSMAVEDLEAEAALDPSLGV